jgi:peptidoglycan/LPS O-acetylase OafA/YrhL
MLRGKNHLPSLDLLRYLCAVAVLIWHYQHFFLLSPDNKIPNFKDELQPFWNLLSVPYKTGFNAVPLFWLLSGIVLSKSYLSVNVKLKKFFINRIARLYPLHLATLVFILIIQLFSTLLVGHPQIYKDNSFEKFLGNLLLMNDGSSFNAPVWSVSVEIFIYIVFAVLIFRQTNRQIFCFSLILVFFLLSQTQLPKLSFLQLNEVGKCGIYFFCGVFIIFVAERLPVLILIILAISFILFGLYNRDNSYFVLIMGVSLSCLALESFIHFEQRIQRIFQTLGNLTYATYLIHIPTQIVLLICIQKVGIDQLTLVTNEYFFMFWFLMVNLISFFIYRSFEIPSRIWVRSKFNT